jgi:hypothetical protein
LPVEPHLCTAVSFYPIFNSPEHHLHKYGLRTHPPAKDTAIGYGEKSNEDHSYDHTDHKEVKILGPEWKPENVKPPFQYVEHEELVAINFHKGRKEQE